MGDSGLSQASDCVSALFSRWENPSFEGAGALAAAETAWGYDLFVSFNDFSGLSDEEQLDPVGALCRRIAFAADSSLDKSGGLGAAFEKIGELAVSPKAIRDWLQQTPCVLLIDELNNMKELAKKNSAPGKDLAQFLKKNFLDMQNRYLIFSSHVVTTADDFSGYMETNSERGVEVVHLPITDK